MTGNVQRDREEFAALKSVSFYRGEKEKREKKKKKRGWISGGHPYANNPVQPGPAQSTKQQGLRVRQHKENGGKTRETTREERKKKGGRALGRQENAQC